jgi:hypothetical protein
MTIPLTLRQIQIRSTATTLVILFPLLFAITHFFFLELEFSSTPFFLRASLGLVLAFLLCWTLSPLPNSPEFQTAGISRKSVIVISLALLLGVLVDLFRDTIVPPWVKSEADLFVTSFLLIHAIFFIAFRHWAQKSSVTSSQPNQLSP